MALPFGGLRVSFLAASLSVALLSLALAQDGAPGSFRAAQEEGLSLKLDPEFLDTLKTTRTAKTAAEVEAAAKEAEEKEKALPLAGAEPGSHRAAQDGQRRVDLSRKVDEAWRVNPILLNRSQGGEPAREDDDVRVETFGLELRKEF